MHRKATVTQIAALQQLGLDYADGRSGITVTRPFMGGPKAGFHYYPLPGDQVMIHPEVRDYPTATTSCVDDPSTLYVLNPGESIILGTDGRALCHVKQDGSTTVISTPAGASISVSVAGEIDLVAPSGQKVNITAPGGFYVNGNQVV